ncbi:nucleotidyltransferase family protein [Prevotella sp. E9-3]|uniref:nucleotidyltransferase family protein n=1 Tax=Prevotella sp. E9-3 TaxID=2913621 RepID=UPI001EDB2628|nr:nucleotidyltransferase family protein [Prevotella sp. E9-3]UKK47486.1 nucleotidyltransferase family protein [Prevotella sp. E9-3]
MKTEEILLKLTRLGLGHYSKLQADDIDWITVKVLSDRQGLTAIILDGIESLPKENRPHQLFLLNWIGEMMQNYEARYAEYEKAISSLAEFYNQHGLKMMVLKGYACSLDWSKSNHRPCGDIDIWQFGQQKEADAALYSSLKSSSASESAKPITNVHEFKIDNSHHHHTVFYWNDFMVENHYDFINVYHHKANVELEKIFKELGKDDSHFVVLNNEKVYLPSPNLHALFLLKHIMNDFTSFSMSLRQLIDWGFFVEKHGKEVDWEWLMGILKKFHMMDFYNTINAICVEDLGFEVCIFPTVRFNPDLKEKVLNDILYPQYSSSEPSSLIPRLVYKYRRWQGNAWKQELCYSESRWSAFWSGVWGHLLKPKTI